MSDDERNLIDLATTVSRNKTCIDAIKKDIDELKSRPVLPRWLCRWAGFITPVVLVVVAGTIVLDQYRLKQLEDSRRRDLNHLLYAIAGELARVQTEPENEPAAVQPSRAAKSSSERTSLRPRPSRVSYTALEDTAQARQIYARLKSRMNEVEN